MSSDGHRISRRRFLGTVGAGAGAMALSPASALAAPADHGQAYARTDRFGRIFRLPPFAEASPGVEAALIELGKPGGLLDAKDPLSAGPKQLIVDLSLSANNPNNPTHTAGTTFFGQFLDHDMTFDASSRLAHPTNPQDARNFRTPALDLDSVYGAGPVAQQELYDPSDHIKLKVESGGLFEDLPRRADSAAIIGDPRNDEHVMIAGLHCAFLLFHNRAVDYVARTGEARRHDGRVRGGAQAHDVALPVADAARVPATDRRASDGRRCAPARPPPVHTVGSVRRTCRSSSRPARTGCGHSMVRPSYRANLAGDNGQPFFGFIFDPVAGRERPTPTTSAEVFAHRGGSSGGRRSSTSATERSSRTSRSTRTISTRTLHVAAWCDREPRRADGAAAAESSPTPDLGPSVRSERRAEDRRRADWRPQTYRSSYRSASASSGARRSGTTCSRRREVVADGLHLGPVGGRIVAEVFIGLLQTDPGSYLATQPHWQPTLPSKNGSFRMIDFLTFAGVDPHTRGQ